MQFAANTLPTALVLSRPGMLTTATREGLRGWRCVRPLEPHPRPLGGLWGVLANDRLPELVVAEHADPLLLAMLCTDLLWRVWPPDRQVSVLIGERDDALRHLLAPLPLPVTVISPTLLLHPQADTIPGGGHPAMSASSHILTRWAVVPLIPALAQAGSVAEAAEWCGIARSTAYSILATTARHLGLSRRWRHPYQWSSDLLAALSAPVPTRQYAIFAAPCSAEYHA